MALIEPAADSRRPCTARLVRSRWGSRQQLKRRTHGTISPCTSPAAEATHARHGSPAFRHHRQVCRDTCASKTYVPGTMVTSKQTHPYFCLILDMGAKQNVITGRQERGGNVFLLGCACCCCGCSGAVVCPQLCCFPVVDCCQSSTVAVSASWFFS